jgi:hypothetical protein
MALLWGLLKPGIVLEWALENHAPAAFRIYRATLPAGEYTQIAEASVEQPASRYRYVDPFIWPGHTYAYRVQAVSDEDRVLGQQEIVVNAVVALPGMLAVFATGIMVGYAAITFWQMRRFDGVGDRS